jgi:hypothetical protein
MMGFEPTTFCMASGSWFVPEHVLAAWLTRIGHGPRCQDIFWITLVSRRLPGVWAPDGLLCPLQRRRPLSETERYARGSAAQPVLNRLTLSLVAEVCGPAKEPRLDVLVV